MPPGCASLPPITETGSTARLHPPLATRSEGGEACLHLALVVGGEPHGVQHGALRLGRDDVASRPRCRS